MSSKTLAALRRFAPLLLFAPMPLAAEEPRSRPMAEEKLGAGGSAEHFTPQAAAAPESPAAPEKSSPPAVPRNLTGRGLLEFQDPFPLAILHLQLPINTLLVLPEGKGKLDVNFHWANSSSTGSNFVVDAETYRLEFGGWYALRDDFYLGAALSILERDGGILDRVVDGFHDAFNIKNKQRDSLPRDAYEIKFTDEQGETHELERGLGLGDLVLKAHWNLNPGDDIFPAASIQGLLGIPTSTPGFGSDNLDFGFNVAFTKSLWRRLHLHGGFGGTLFLEPQVQGLPYQRVGFQGIGGVEFAVIERISLLFQIMSFGPLFESVHPLDQRRTYVAGGLKWEFIKGVQVEISFIENLAPFENTADIALETAMSIRF